MTAPTGGGLPEPRATRGPQPATAAPPGDGSKTATYPEDDVDQAQGNADVAGIGDSQSVGYKGEMPMTAIICRQAAIYLEAIKIFTSPCYLNAKLLRSVQALLFSNVALFFLGHLIRNLHLRLSADS